ncbi:hypothetical protein SLE2022_206860 [Rubroshorea leprosula]
MVMKHQICGVRELLYGFVRLMPLPVWIKSHGTDRGFEDAKPVIVALRSKGIHAIGASGFCWGEIKAPIAVLGAEIDRQDFSTRTSQTV